MRFRAEQHLRRQLDFQHVRTHGRRHECGAFTLWYARRAPAAPPLADSSSSTATASAPRSPERELGDRPPETSASPALPANAQAPRAPAPCHAEAPGAKAGARLGVVASRASVGNAVQRARAKRRLREVFRAHQQLVPAGYDLLLVARAALNRLEYREIEQRFVDACRRIFPSRQ